MEVITYGDDQEGQTDGDRLIRAISYGDHQEMKALLEAGADPNSLSTDGRLPLQIAVYPGRDFKRGYDIVKLLIDHGANPNQPNTEGVTPMDVVAKHGTVAMMEALLDAGGDSSLNIEISMFFGEAYRLTREERNTRIRKLVDGFVASGFLPAQEADDLYRKFVEMVEDMNQAATPIATGND